MQRACENRNATSQFCRVAACEAEDECRRLCIFPCELRQRLYLHPKLPHLFSRLTIRLPCLEPSERSYSCTCVNDVEHAVQVFVGSTFENLNAFGISLAHAADMVAEMAFGDEFRKNGLIE